MKLKDLLSEGFGPCAGCDDEDCECHGSTEEEDDVEACPGCGRKPGDGYGADCDDPLGCGYWKDWAKEAMAELRRDMKANSGMNEATFFDRYMKETLQIEERRAKVNKAPVMEEGYGKVRQKRVQELPLNRIRIGVK
jgi:hypothetical protein